MRKVWPFMFGALMVLGVMVFAMAQEPAPQPGVGAGEPPTSTETSTAPPGDAGLTEAPLGDAVEPGMIIEPPAPIVVLPRPVEVEVIDVPNDDGTSIGLLWNWQGAATEQTGVKILVQFPGGDWLKELEPSAEEQTLVQSAVQQLATDLAGIVPQRDALVAQVAAADEALQRAIIAKAPNVTQLRRAFWDLKSELAPWALKRDKAWERFQSRVTRHGKNLYEKTELYSYLMATLASSTEDYLSSEYGIETELGKTADSIGTKGDSAERFGLSPDEAGKLYAEIKQIAVYNPDLLAGTYSDQPNELDVIPPKTLRISLKPNQVYNIRMRVAEGETSEDFDLGGGTPRVNYFISTKFNNMFFAVVFAAIILIAIMVARRNPNMFIRRINGLEAVDEAIGRATEMGKPVLYLCGMDPLASLSTLAAINILGRVARRIADYDSDLIVPCKDPVVLTVAQEVVKEGYIDQGRPDAYKDDNIFFVTDDQFSYTATTCATMMREKPAANFFMGYYYAESLLLAETGAATGAIQIAGTDALAQLPFFITTCDYTLIGEELYAASAYLSREPLLLGSLKGQDIGKALIMLFIVVQTLLFIIYALLLLGNPLMSTQDWSWFQQLVTPL